MTMEIREAVPADASAVIDIAQAAWYSAYGGFLDPATIERGLRENYDPELVDAGIEHPEIKLFVAEDDGMVVGYASAEQTWADEVEVHTLSVHPDRWGEGIGSQLLDRVAAWATRQDVERLVCAVAAENTVGCAFFESCGFQRGSNGVGEIGGQEVREYEFELRL